MIIRWGRGNTSEDPRWEILLQEIKNLRSRRCPIQGGNRKGVFDLFPTIGLTITAEWNCVVSECFLVVFLVDVGDEKMNQPVFEPALGPLFLLKAPRK
jgi:hypothetical protein